MPRAPWYAGCTAPRIMRAYAVAALIGFATFASIAAACSFKPRTDSEGELGNLRFAYSGLREPIIAATPGTASVTVQAGGAQAVAQFRVVR